jgi:hypothetical protein
MKDFVKRRPRLTSVILWLAAIITIGRFTYQDKTGPTYPLEGDLETARGTLHFTFPHSLFGSEYNYRTGTEQRTAG